MTRPQRLPAPLRRLLVDIEHLLSSLAGDPDLPSRWTASVVGRARALRAELDRRQVPRGRTPTRKG